MIFSSKSTLDSNVNYYSNSDLNHGEILLWQINTKGAISIFYYFDLFLEIISEKKSKC